MELPLSQLSAALGVCARRTVSSHHRGRSVSRPFTARRRAQQTEQFKGRMQQRNAIEGTISELARAHGLRRSRYRGFAKVELQNLFIGTACNVKRWLRIVAEAKIGSDSHLLAFRNALYRVRRLFWALRLNSGSFSCPSQEPPFLTRV
jgi:hypothetical protein